MLEPLGHYPRKLGTLLRKSMRPEETPPTTTPPKLTVHILTTLAKFIASYFLSSEKNCQQPHNTWSLDYYVLNCLYVLVKQCYIAIGL